MTRAIDGLPGDRDDGDPDDGEADDRDPDRGGLPGDPGVLAGGASRRAASRSRGAVGEARFRQVLGHFPTGVTIVTAAGPDGPVGLAVASFTSLSLAPPLVAFCVDRRSLSWPRIRSAGSFCVNVLSERQEALCRAFASRGADKFAGVGWEPTGSGSPLLAGVLAWIDCTIEAVHDGGDHQICVGRVEDLDVGAETPGPLVFYRGGYGRFEP